MDLTQDPATTGGDISTHEAPEWVLGELLSHVHRLATMHPLSHFHRVCCEELAGTLALGSWHWLESSHAYRETKAVLQWASTENTSVRELRKSIVGAESNHNIVIGLSEASPDLGDTFWQALIQSLVHLHDNLGLSLVSSALNAPDEAAAALVSTNGALVDASPAFFHYIRDELPDWDGVQLPHGILNNENRDAHGTVWRSLYIHIMEDEGYIRLLAHLDRRQDALTPQELDIAHHIAKGCTFKQAGKALGLSPSEVASQLYNLYAKLGIGRRSELLAWLEEHDRQLRLLN